MIRVIVFALALVQGCFSFSPAAEFHPQLSRSLRAIPHVYKSHMKMDGEDEPRIMTEAERIATRDQRENGRRCRAAPRRGKRQR